MCVIVAVVYVIRVDFISREGEVRWTIAMVSYVGVESGV